MSKEVKKKEPNPSKASEEKKLKVSATEIISPGDKDVVSSLSSGKMTFIAEGSLDPKNAYYCGKLHHPTSGSGVTIGKGYDMKEKTREQVERDLKKAGISSDVAAELSKGAKLSGKDADDFTKKYKNFTVENESVGKLFSISYEEKEKLAERISKKHSVDYNSLPDNVKEVVTDMFYRGDLPPAKQKEFYDSIKESQVILPTLLLGKQNVGPFN